MNNSTVRCNYCGAEITNYKGSETDDIECDICHDEFYEEERNYHKKGVNRKQKQSEE